MAIVEVNQPEENRVMAKETAKPEPAKPDVLSLLDAIESVSTEDLQSQVAPLKQQRLAIDRKIRRIDGIIRARSLVGSRGGRKKKADAKPATDCGMPLPTRIYERVKLQPCRPGTIAEDLGVDEGAVLRVLSTNSERFQRGPNGAYHVRNGETA